MSDIFQNYSKTQHFLNDLANSRDQAILDALRKVVDAGLTMQDVIIFARTGRLTRDVHEESRFGKGRVVRSFFVFDCRPVFLLTEEYKYSTNDEVFSIESKFSVSIL